MWGIFLSLIGAIGLNPVPLIASLIGIEEPALKLLISVFMAYPCAIVYHKFVKKDYKHYSQLYFLLSGLDMAYYNFGINMYHNAIPAFVMYITTMIFGPGQVNCIITIAFNMVYLLAGYFITESEEYDITWTMPQCVLTLKLIALSFDMWDGQKMKAGEELSANNKKTAIDTPPTMMEIFEYVYFPACFLIGPIFTFRRYKDFITDKFPIDSNDAVYESKALNRLVQGTLYLAGFQVGMSVFSMSYMCSDEFWTRSILYRHFYCGLWAHFALYKYIACWLITEASCIRFGLSYNGTEKSADGQVVTKWDGCSNIKLYTFETATKFQHYIDSFNINTNYFAAEYVYKRLKFLGDRNLSQFFTLLFLAMWHGIRSGYYMTFFNEFMIMLMEKDFEAMLKKSELYNKMWSNVYFKYILYAVLKMYTIVFMGWSLVPFDVKVFSKWWSIYYSLYFSGFVLFLPWLPVYKSAFAKLLNYLSNKLK